MPDTNDLIVVQVEGEDRIDSRVVAKELGVEHEVFMRTCLKYKGELEDLGQLRFQNGVGYRVQGGGNPQKYIMLNEDQSIFAATLSRNSQEVVAFKLKLTKAFSSARKAIGQSNNTKISDRLSAAYDFLEDRIPDNYWAVICELHREIRNAEMLGLLDGGAFPEISVGLKWAAYARHTLKLDTTQFPTYEHQNPGKKKIFPAACYPLASLKAFRYWFRHVYLPNDCPVYVQSRAIRIVKQISK